MARQQRSAPSQRQLRVGEELRHALARILTRERLRDPVLAEASITVTEVRVSPDLKHATAFVLPFGSGAVDEVVAALRRAAPFLRSRLGREVTLRYTPEIRFEADTSFDAAARIERLLRRPRVARDLEHGDAPADETESDDENGQA